MQTENASKIPEDEIDLKSMSSKIFSFFAYPVSLIFSNIFISLGFIVVGILLAVTFKYLTPKTYTASFVFRSTDIRDKIYLKVLSDIPALLKKNDKPALARLLEIDSSLVSKLVRITIIPSGKNPADSTNTVAVELEASDNSIMLPVQNSIMQFLEKNPYYARIRALQKEQIEMNLEQVNKDLAQLDSLKKLQLALYEKQKISLQNTVMLNDLINPTAAYNVSADRIAKKASLLAQTVFLDRFILIKGCIISKRHSWPPRVMVLCLFTIPFSLLLCSGFLHYRSRRK